MCGEPLPMFGEDQRRERDYRAYAGSQPEPDEDTEWEAARPSRYGRGPLD
jgi:hypothetical protein